MAGVVGACPGAGSLPAAGPEAGASTGVADASGGATAGVADASGGDEFAGGVALPGAGWLAAESGVSSMMGAGLASAGMGVGAVVAEAGASTAGA